MTENPAVPAPPVDGGWSMQAHLRREFPDMGRGDFRSPAMVIKQSEGHTVSEFKYQSHNVIQGKPSLSGLPSTFGEADQVTTLVIHMYDSLSAVAAELTYSVFPKYDAIARSVKITNKGNEQISVEKLASFSADLPYRDYEMLELHGEWSREATRIRRKVDYGTQG